MKLISVGFRELIPAYGHVWQRILPHHQDVVDCDLDLKTELLTLTLKKPEHYAGRQIQIPLSNIAYYEVEQEKVKNVSKTSRKSPRKKASKQA